MPGLLDFLGQISQPLGTALTAKWQGQQVAADRQKAEAAAAIEAARKQREAEDTHLKTMAEVSNLQNKFANEKALQDARISGESDAVIKRDVATANRQTANEVMGYMALNPTDARSIHAKEVIARNGGDIMKALPEIGQGWGFQIKDYESEKAAKAALEREKVQQQGQTSRTQAEIAARASEGAADRANRLTVAGIQHAGGAGGRSGQAQQKAQGFIELTQAPGKILDEASTPGVGSRQRQELPLVGNFMVSDAERNFNTAADTYVSAAVYALSGAAITKQEQDRMYRMFIPQAGDDDATKAIKKNARAAFQRALQRWAGQGIEDRNTPFVQALRSGANSQQLLQTVMTEGGASDATATPRQSSITPAERAALRTQGWSDEKLNAKFGPP